MFYVKEAFFIISQVIIIFTFIAIFFYYNVKVMHLQSFTPEEMLNKINEVQANYTYWHEQEIQADKDFKDSLRGTDQNEQRECLDAKKECERNARQENRMLNILRRNYDNNVFSDETESVLGKRNRD